MIGELVDQGALACSFAVCMAASSACWFTLRCLLDHCIQLLHHEALLGLWQLADLLELLLAPRRRGALAFNVDYS